MRDAMLELGIAVGMLLGLFVLLLAVGGFLAWVGVSPDTFAGQYAAAVLSWADKLFIAILALLAPRVIDKIRSTNDKDNDA